MIRNRVGHRIWTPEDDALLRAGWAAGRPVRAIAEEIGITKNAAMGRAHRLKLEGRPSPIKRARPSSAFNHSAAAANGGLQHQASPRVSQAKTMPRTLDGAQHPGRNLPKLADAASSPPLGGVGVLFGEAKSTQCAYPLWGPEKLHVARTMYVCGHPAARRADSTLSPYCAAHHARCFVRRAAPAGAAGAAA
jgi:hypothetical protein